MEKDYKKTYARQRKYDAKTYKKFSVTLMVRYDDKDFKKICKKIESVPSKNSYIMGLIRKDIGEDNK